MALNGREGHKFSHAPQPIHLSSLITGIFTDWESFESDGTILIAPTGQWRAQFPHSTPSVSGMQFFLIHTAWPI